MEPLTLGFCSLLVLVALLAFGVPVAVALGLTGLVGMGWGISPRFALAMAQTVPYAVVAKYAWAVLPLFVLMGGLAAASGITGDLFRAAEIWLGRLRGGLYLAVIAGSAGFAAASGSTVANSVVFTRLALPQLLDRGYSRSLSLGCICAAGTFAAMIPPSLTMVIYAILTEQSVGQLLLAGLVPGLLSAFLYAVLVLVMVKLRPGLSPDPDAEQPPWRLRLSALGGVCPVAVLVVLVLGGLYAGVFPPSAAGAVGAAGTLVLAWRRLGPGLRWLPDILRDSAALAGSIFLILVGGALYSRFLVAGGVVDAFTTWLVGVAHSATGLLLLLCAMYLVLGCYLDTASMMVITLPFVFPVVESYGIHPIWFGIIFVKLIEIAVITPPVGLNLYAVLGAAGERADFRHLAVGVLPFLLVDLLTLAILLAFPSLSTWLPELMAAA